MTCLAVYKLSRYHTTSKSEEAMPTHHSHRNLTVNVDI